MVSSPGLPVMVLLPSPAKMLLATSGALIMSLPVSAKIVPLPSPVIRLSLFWELIVWLAVLSESRLLGEPIDFDKASNRDKSLDIPKSACAVLGNRGGVVFDDVFSKLSGTIENSFDIYALVVFERV
jgi:hypothetical protein